MGSKQTIRRLRRELELARAEARTDELTGLGNRRRWQEATQALQAARRRFAVVFFDLANLKAANALLGHAGADELLRAAAAAVRAESDLACRLGGDELALILADAGEAEAAAVRDRIEERFGLRELAPGAVVFVAGGEASWEPGQDVGERVAAADARSEERKRARKVALGVSLTREGTLAAIA